MSQPVLWLIAGGNGAGKTTYYQQYLKPHGVIFVNADEIAKQVFPGREEEKSYDAAMLAVEQREQLIEARQSFCTETVFSHPSKIELIVEAKAVGYLVNLVFIHVDNPELNVARVAGRVQAGGHSVPEAKIRERLTRLIGNIRQAIPYCNNVVLYDNSDVNTPYRRVADRQNGGAWLLCNAGSVPAWVDNLISDH